MLQLVALAALSTSLLSGSAVAAPSFTVENIALAPGASGVIHAVGPESVHGALLIQSDSDSLRLDGAFDTDCEAINTAGTWMCGDMTSTWNLTGELHLTLDDTGTRDRQVITTSIRVLGSSTAEATFTTTVDGDAVELEGFTAEAKGFRVSGTGAPGAKVHGVDANGEALAATLIDSQGTWSTPVWDDGSAAAVDLWFSEDLNGAKSDSVKVNVDFGRDD